MSKPITAEEHNAKRREVKARQRANARAKAKGNRSQGGDGFGRTSMFEAAKKDKARHEARKRKQAENEARLFAELETKGFVMLNRPNRDDYDGSTDGWFEEMQDYEYACKRYEIDVADLKRACKRDNRKWVWEEMPTGMAFARPRRKVA